ncbi:MAG: class I SAM-dependent methyltransferase [Solirubrobacteraceae bacterium]
MAETEAGSEHERLGLLESARDPATIDRLKRLGVSAGWRCLEVGAGRGSIARWLAERATATGTVVAADIDPRFLTDLPENVEVRGLDVRTDEVEAGGYDLVHCRLLLMHLEDPATVLARLAGALAPGGVLLAEEGDFGLYHYSGQADADALTSAARRALDAMADAGIMAAYFGRGLPGMLAATGLQLLGGEVETHVSGPGEPGYEFLRASLLAVVPKLIAAGVIEDNLARLEGFFSQPGSLVTGASLVAAWGRRTP